MSLGSVRHYFNTHNELLAFCIELLSLRVNQRIQNLPFTGELRADMELVIWELMPLDEERLGESEIWLAFAGRAASDASIRAISIAVHEELYAAFKGMMERLKNRQTRSSIDVEYEARRLHAWWMVLLFTVSRSRGNPAGGIVDEYRHPSFGQPVRLWRPSLNRCFCPGDAAM